jgi:hypothetical protein
MILEIERRNVTLIDEDRILIALPDYGTKHLKGPLLAVYDTDDTQEATPRRLLSMKRLYIGQRGGMELK